MLPPLPHPDAWLAPFIETLRDGGRRVVELGCGPMVRATTDGLFRIEHLAHRTITRHENPKQAWECVARKVG